jgi:hypothetical protein
VGAEIVQELLGYLGVARSERKADGSRATTSQVLVSLVRDFDVTNGPLKSTKRHRMMVVLYRAPGVSLHPLPPPPGASSARMRPQ